MSVNDFSNGLNINQNLHYNILKIRVFLFILAVNHHNDDDAE